MIYLIRKLSKTHSCAKQSFTKPLLVIFLHKLIHWCIYTVSQAGLWALGRSAPYSLLSILITTCTTQVEGLEHRPHSFPGTYCSMKRAELTPRTCKLMCIRGKENKKGSFAERRAERPCFFKSPNRRSSGMFTPQQTEAHRPTTWNPGEETERCGNKYMSDFWCQLNMTLKESTSPHERQSCALCPTEREHSMWQEPHHLDKLKYEGQREMLKW